MADQDDKLKISWDDLSTESVEKKLLEQQAVSSTQEHYEQANVSVPKRSRRFDFLLNTVVYLTLFGALGGLLGWGFGEVLHFRPNQQAEARDLIRQYDEIVIALKKVQATPEQIDRTTRPIVEAGKDNPYFNIYINPKLSDLMKEQKTVEQLELDEGKDFVASLLFYGVCGVTIAVMLAIADSVIERNINGAIIYGSIAAVVGVAGGLAVALVINRIQQDLAPMREMQSTSQMIVTQVISWGLLGLFLASTPGIVLRNGKRLLIGMVGGVIGGSIGGLAYVPMQELVGNEHISRLIAVVLIGGLAGLACGLIENVVKTGWMKVESGLIAGKQFVLYRNPTFIGSHPMSHIYLFNDPSVGRRHACVHIVPGGYELEDLPLGTRTYINDKPINRARLKSGDRVRVGQSEFLFQERSKAK
jgi:hypothetical protein